MSFSNSQGGEKLKLAALYLPLVLFTVFYTIYIKNPAVSGVIIIIFGTTLAFMHGVPRYGWKGMLVFVALCLGVSISLENLSIIAGFPFGNYHYTHSGPRLLHVPLVVGPIYFTMGYMSWTVANAMFGFADKNFSSGRGLIAMPIAAAFAMVQWDVVMDPLQSTYAKGWIWHDGGGYFGVPLSNYLGWFLTVWLFYQAFALYLRRKGVRTASDSALTNHRAFQAAPIFFYLAFAFTWALPYFVFGNETLTDKSGTIWTLRDMSETAVVIMLYTMLPTALMALYRVFCKKTNQA